MKPSLLKLLLGFSGLVSLAKSNSDEPTITYEQLYTAGKQAYTKKEWTDCVGFMRRTVEDYNYYNDETIWCREMCEMKYPSSAEASGMVLTHLTAQKALCLFRCKVERLGEDRPPPQRHLLWFELEEREPYRYMHICYWHLGDLKNAVKAAYTYLVRNPEHQETIENLQFYMKQDDYAAEMLDDFQRKDYETLYMDGVNAYHNSDWFGCIDRLERSLEKVLKEEQRCRLDCQDKIDWSSVEGTLEMDIIETSMKASVLRCAHGCFDRLGWVNGRKVGGHIISAHFEYMHMCQYQVMRGTDACISVANYLLFDNSPAMRRNRWAYEMQYGKPELFRPDQKYVDIHRKMILERRLLNYIEREFKVSKASQMAAESGKDREKWNEDVEDKDHFPYGEVGKLLTDGECRVLRAPIQTHLTDLLVEELTKRVAERLATRLSPEHPPHVSCSTSEMHAHCDRALVLSVDEPNCSMWLPPEHKGCSIVFCAV